MFQEGVLSFHNIPHELKSLRQFVVWKLVQQDTGKPTKLPYNPNTGYLASVTDPSTWGTFEQALAVVHNVSGIGFVLTENDPYSVIDLDYTEDTEEANRQVMIAKAFDSYSEVSPSQKGLHIWVRGKVPSGRRKGCIEIYSSGRYMTVTGFAYNNVGINDHDNRLKLLWNEMKSGNDTPDVIESQPQRVEDNEIIKLAGEAVNGEKFVDLFEGRWQKYYQDEDKGKISCNEADFALINIIAYYTQNVEQITRIFKRSNLAKRQKARRDKYVHDMIKRSFDRQPPPVDLTTIQQKLEQQLAEMHNPEPEKEIKPLPKRSDWDLPDGLVGELIRFFYDASPLPVPEIAIATALGLMAGVCGRSYNISASGLNQYILLLANTGAGKDSIGKNIDKLMSEVLRTVPAASEFIGPGEIASPQALIKYMDKTSTSFVTLAGEVSLLLKQICGMRANRHEIGLKRLLLQLYGASGHGNTFKPMIYSDSANNTKSIASPAFTLLGESTPEEFYEMLSDEMVRSGFLPRFSIIEYDGKRPHMNKHHYKVKPSTQLVERFSMLCAYSLQLNNGNNIINVQCDEHAQKILDDFELKCHNSLNDANNETQRHLWNRAHLKALRLSALLSVGVNYLNPVINHEQAMWAIKMIEKDVKNLLNRFEVGDIGLPSIHNEQHKEIKKSFVKYITGRWEEVEKYNGATPVTWSNKVVPLSFITSFCRAKHCFKTDRLGPNPAIKNAIQSLIECGEIAEVGTADKKEKGLSLNGKVYAIVNLYQLKR